MQNLESSQFTPTADASNLVFVSSTSTSSTCSASDQPTSHSALQHARDNLQQQQLTHIQAQPDGILECLRELAAHRDLLYFLVRREVKVRYAQSAIGIGWAVLQPLFPMLIFTIIFGRLAKISSDGVPYALFSFVGLVPWLYFSNGVTDGVNSLIANAHVLSKVYFPRLLIPLSSVIARFIDFCVASVVLIALMGWYGIVPNSGIIVIPWLLVMLVLSTVGIACWLSTLAIQYRDVKHALSFLIQIMMYTAPVVYSANLIPERWQLIYALNPMVAVIEGLRAALLGTREMPWSFIGVGSVSALLLATTGASYFIRKQRLFADVA